MMRVPEPAAQLNTPAAYGAWIKRLRKAADPTQDALAQRVGCASATIRKIEAGQRRPSQAIAERLCIQGEQVIGVGGLALPQDETATEIERAGAVALFLRRARQVQPGFRPTEADLDAIMHICRLVEGLPLGVELAATCMRMLSCAEIAEEIGRSLDFLVGYTHDLPARHRSLRAVFEQSWRLLTGPQRRALWRLALLEGSFTCAEATNVLGFEFSVLSSEAPS